MKTLCYRVQYQDEHGKWRPGNMVAHAHATQESAQREHDESTADGRVCRIQLIPRAEAKQQALALGARWMS